MELQRTRRARAGIAGALVLVVIAAITVGCAPQTTSSSPSPSSASTTATSAPADPGPLDAAVGPDDGLATGLWRYPEVMPVAVYLAPDSRVYMVGGTTGLFTKIWSDPDAVAEAMPRQVLAGTWRQDGQTVTITRSDGTTTDARGELHGDSIDLSVLNGEPVPGDPVLQLTRMSRQ